LNLSRKSNSSAKPSAQFWILAAFLCVVFLTGGASRIEVQSLVILRPLSVFACAIALLTVKKEHCLQYRELFFGFAAIFFLAAIHLVPLPNAVWSSLNGRAELQAIDDLVGLKDVWRPLTLTPMNGWHALLSLFAPLAVLLLGIQFSRDDLNRLLPLLIGLGSLSALLGLLQVIGDPQSPLYLYEVTNNGSAVGFFSNRNHAATLLACLFPMLIVFASAQHDKDDTQKVRQMVAFSIAIVLVPLILITGSRSGLLGSIVSLVGAALLYQMPNPSIKKSANPAAKNFLFGQWLVPAIVVGLGLLTFFLSRAEAIDRLFAPDLGGESRSDFLLISIELFWKYFPLGSGAGSYADVYKVLEPAKFIDPTYQNRAHNDWAEIAVTFGVPGVLLLLALCLLFVRRTFIIWFKLDAERRSTKLARAASIAIVLIALASIGDYPLRTPIMMCVFAVLILWLVSANSNSQTVPHASQGV
jgi:hypothetical protein